MGADRDAGQYRADRWDSRWIGCALALLLGVAAACSLGARAAAATGEPAATGAVRDSVEQADGAGGKAVHAASCARADVQTAVDAAEEGDFVVVPAGSCEWTTVVGNRPAVLIDDKAITLLGAGVGQTVITDGTGTAWNETLIGVEGVQGKALRITGFTFAEGGYPAVVQINGTSKSFRVDNCRFENAVEFHTGVYADGYTYGVVDHCSFLNSRVLVREDGDPAWQRPLSLGTANAVYVEDNQFECTAHCNAVDAGSGARYVFRYNTMRNTHVEAHSGCPSGLRATFSYEIYSNTMVATSPTYRPFLLRGGTGVIFGNVVSGSYTTPHIHVDDQRTCDGVGGLDCHDPWDRCDGDSIFDGNQPGGQGYPCRDQIGRSTDSGRYSPQSLQPLYEWDNTIQGGGDVDIVINPAMCELTGEHIKEGREYYNDTARPGYAPYEYPHPLTRDLVLRASPGNGMAYLNWTVRTILPPAATWRAIYYTMTTTVPLTVTEPASTTRSCDLSGLQNYVWYTVTLNSLDGPTPILTDAVRVMPTDRFSCLPLILRGH
jgi:hypothetical protein